MPYAAKFPRRSEKALVNALIKFREKKTDEEPTVDEIYKLLEVNMQKRIRKLQIHAFLVRNALGSDKDRSPQNSSTSDDPASDSDSKPKKRKPSSQTPSPDGKTDYDSRERRTIKRKRVFDPSDYKHIKKPEKPVKDTFCKLCGKGFKTDSPDAPPPTKTTCVGCKKCRAHRACIPYDIMPWRCENCALCSICDGQSPDNSPLFRCVKCKEAVHQDCGNIDEPFQNNWICSPCRSSAATEPGKPRSDEKEKKPRPAVEEEKEAAKAKSRSVEEKEQPKPKANAVRRSTSKESECDGLIAHEDEIPDCSRWTPHQVYSYLIIYVPSEDAKAFLDQEIDGRSLKLMQRNDVIANFNLKLGPALKVYAQVKRLQDRSNNIKLCWP